MALLLWVPDSREQLLETLCVLRWRLGSLGEEQLQGIQV